MKMHGGVLLVALVFVISLVIMSASRSTTARADAPQTPSNKSQPVENNVHEFMEYVFEPTYKRLKPLMAREPADNNAWKAVKSDALILAEGGNLLLLRGSKKDTAAWGELSAALRESGGKLYQSAKKRTTDLPGRTTK